MPDPPWRRPLGIDAVIARWLRRARPHGSGGDDDHARGCFRADQILPASDAVTAPFPADLDPRLVAALGKRGIEQLFAHQAQAIREVQAGRHVVIATPTASGKSLCFHLPVLDRMVKDPAATAIYLYPTKALSRDQEQSVQRLVSEAELPIAATVYDGDTPGDARRAARQRCQIVMTNPDMLHAGILPQHASWARLFQNLRYVVVDEMHTYRGVFGSHVAHVLARLRRVARFHGADPVFISATATIGNPREHAARLIGAPEADVAVVDQSTAPRGSRRILVYNPPVVNAELGIRASYLKRAVRLTADLVEARVPTILFGQSRNNVEIMLKYLRDRFAGSPSVHQAIFAYRGGYLPGERRRVENGLREGEILCVVATSALELGIDIGDLDAVVCAGYPGSLAGTWQRFGRAGRRSAQSLAVLVTSSTPLDQYLAHHPELLLDGGIEQARVDPDNAEIAIQHLKCAAYELPFRSGERFGVLPEQDTEAALDFLADHGVVHRGRERYHWSEDSFPAGDVSLRSVGWDNTVIIELETQATLAELDWHSTHTMLHEQAIYQHDGRQYQVEQLDYDNHKAFVRLVEPDYFTTAQTQVKVRVLEDEASDTLPLPAPVSGPPVGIGWGDVVVTEKVVGYKKIKFHTHENAGYGDVRLPDVDKHTTSFWLTLPAARCEALGRATAIEGLRGLGHALELVATLALMCDPHDIGRAIEDAAQSPPVPSEGSVDDELPARLEPFSATVYLYDHVPGGVGLAARIHERAPDLLRHAAELVAGCSCGLGCPSCVGATAVAAAAADPDAPPIADGGASRFDRKTATLALAWSLGLVPAPPSRDDTPAPPPTRSSSRHLQLVT
ncbi:MAG: DEAD/DEAH box helicase [Polyangiaceae bacterium]